MLGIPGPVEAFSLLAEAIGVHWAVIFIVLSLIAIYEWIKLCLKVFRLCVASASSLWIAFSSNRRFVPIYVGLWALLQIAFVLNSSTWLRFMVFMEDSDAVVRSVPGWSAWGILTLDISGIEPHGVEDFLFWLSVSTVILGGLVDFKVFEHSPFAFAAEVFLWLLVAPYVALAVVAFVLAVLLLGIIVGLGTLFGIVTQSLSSSDIATLTNPDSYITVFIGLLGGLGPAFFFLAGRGLMDLVFHPRIREVHYDFPL